jgi:putative hydrolase of the HAD superfamily
MPFTTLFFDLDDTLYDSTNGLWTAIRERMSEYMLKRLGLQREEIPSLRRFYYETYGTTLRGLQKHHQVDADDFLAFVHDIPLEQFINPQPELRALLLSLPQSKWIFTNADAPHAHRVLDRLAVADCFDGIIDVRALGFACKPQVEAYQLAMALAGEADPKKCVLLDDSVRNLAPAHAMGIFTILVGGRGPLPAAARSVAALQELPECVPELWVEGDQ